ncbi:LegC family aminotransferase [Flavobacteriales bacterium]|jgi:perosamine synthetase|nr:LegC family aminotransferase [Flavobacteriales bacterium]MDB9702035.1 LegC family aminotransferase [Flavobacteriales bacterium]MDB9931542.1 LegC family aminotransferase [Flavobacteriales bacterium]MDC0015478.1 LegC family aminotransferase [Flavobacteriales bacterium]MDC1370565.1 LegC family aminotransferase [Flavobacteriales bacterium]
MYESLIKHIRHLFNTPTEFIPLHEPRFIGNEKKYVMDAIDSTFVSSVGKYVDQFEEMMCEITGAKYAIAIVNGTNALHLSMVLAGVEPGDEVITQSLTFIATANAISYCQATSHFVDVDKETMGLSPTLLDAHLQEISEMRNGECFNKNTNKRIKACVPMHTFGLPLYIDGLVKVCDKYNITLIEDAAESLGSYYKGQHTGTFGKLGTFSFNGNKTVTSGGGGAIITDDEELAKRAKYLSTQAKIPHKWEYKHDAIGYNYRMPNLNAALACAQLEQLDFYIKNKRELNDNYAQFLVGNGDVKLVQEVKNAKSNYWLNAVILKDKSERDNFLEELNSKGVMTRPIWALMNHLEMFKDCPKSDLSNSEWLEDRVVNIPSSVRI